MESAVVINADCVSFIIRTDDGACFAWNAQLQRTDDRWVLRWTDNEGRVLRAVKAAQAHAEGKGSERDRV